MVSVINYNVSEKSALILILIFLVLCGTFRDVNSDKDDDKMDEKIGGLPVPIEKFPYVAYVVGRNFINKETRVCGASLVTTKWLITAAHCIHKIKIELYVYMGINDASKLNDKDVQKRRVLLIKKHPKYIPKKQCYDIGLIKLKQPFDLTAKIQLASLPETSMNYNGALVKAVDWVAKCPKQSNFCEKLLMKIIKVWKDNDKKCTCKSNQAICVGKKYEGPSHAVGGGPLVAKGVVIGVYSKPDSENGLYENVYEYIQWIKKKTGMKATSCRLNYNILTIILLSLCNLL